MIFLKGVASLISKPEMNKPRVVTRLVCGSTVFSTVAYLGKKFRFANSWRNAGLVLG